MSMCGVILKNSIFSPIPLNCANQESQNVAINYIPQLSPSLLTIYSSSTEHHFLKLVKRAISLLFLPQMCQWSAG